MGQDVAIIGHGAVLELRFDRPEKKNAITGAMYDRMTAALAAPGPAVRAILFTATGETFTAGNDIKDFLAMRDLMDAPPARFIDALATATIPLVAAVNGPAIGVGATMLLHCDLVYAAPTATLAMPFVDLGLVPEAGSSMLLPARIGLARATAMLLLSEAMPAAEAHAAGLVNAIVPQPEMHALAAAQRLAAKPPAALAASRALLRQGAEALAAHMRAEQAAFSTALAGPEAREAFTAFLERRPPQFD